MERLVCLLTVLIAGAFSSFGVADGQVYRYRNHVGQMVLDYSVPPEYVANGYEVLSSGGSLLETIPPLSEIVKRDPRQELEDQILLLKYGHPRDVERMKQRQLDEIKRLNASSLAYIDLLEQQILDFESRAAESEKQGLRVDPEVTLKIEESRRSIERLYRKIRDNKARMGELVLRYDADYQRLLFLNGNAPTTVQ